MTYPGVPEKQAPRVRLLGSSTRGFTGARVGPAPPLTAPHGGSPGVDATGSAAVVKVSARTVKWDFIDYISLLKVDGRWRIVAKVYHREPRAEAPSRPTSASP